MKQKVAALLMFLAGPFGAASIDLPEHPDLDAQCQVEFRVRNAGTEVTGTLGGVKTSIQFDAEDLNRSRILATADPATITTGIGIRDKHLKRSDYFHVAAYPDICLRSKAFRKSGNNRFTGRFEVTIKGISKEVIIPFALTRTGKGIRYSGSFELNRLDFALGEKSTLLDEKVKVSITVLQTVAEANIHRNSTK